MPKFFYVLYFKSVHASFFEYLTRSARKIFKNFTVEHSTQAGEYSCLMVKGDEPIYPWKINKLESLFGDSIGEIIFSHNNATTYGEDVASMEEVGPQHVLSVGAALNFSIIDILTLKRFFFIRNLRKMVLNTSRAAGFYYFNNFVCFFLQSGNPVLETEVEFCCNRVKKDASVLFKTVI